MKNRFVKFFAVLLAVFMLLPFVVAADSYSTYTYSIDGTQLASPHAYTPNMSINWTDMGLPQALVKVEDMVVDKAGNVYLVDETLSTVFVLDKNFKYKFHINSFINEKIALIRQRFPIFSENMGDNLSEMLANQRALRLERRALRVQKRKERRAGRKQK